MFVPVAHSAVTVSASPCGVWEGTVSPVSTGLPRTVTPRSPRSLTNRDASGQVGGDVLSSLPHFSKTWKGPQRPRQEKAVK